MTTRILLADDHELMREGLRSIVGKDKSMEIVGEASTGREAVALSITLEPDVVVMDVGMKDLNGIDATRQIRGELPENRGDRALQSLGQPLRERHARSGCLRLRA